MGFLISVEPQKDYQRAAKVCRGPEFITKYTCRNKCVFSSSFLLC